MCHGVQSYESNLYIFIVFQDPKAGVSSCLISGKIPLHEIFTSAITTSVITTWYVWVYLFFLLWIHLTWKHLMILRTGGHKTNVECSFLTKICIYIYNFVSLISVLINLCCFRMCKQKWSQTKGKISLQKKIKKHVKKKPNSLYDAD